MIGRRRLARLFLGVLAITASAVGPAPADDYIAGTTFVARGANTTVVDLGFVECNTSAPSVGGACIPWTAGGQAIKVTDDRNGTDVAFQVCVDNDGDNLCGSLPTIAGCDDDIVFSHFEGGAFSNPLAAPTSFRSGCPGGFPGWVVFLCQGTHATSAPHTHEVTTGTVTSAASGGPSGEFCGGPVGKPYIRPTVPNGCLAQGTMHTGAMFAPPTATSTAFAMAFSLSTCLSAGVNVTGQITGSCGAATGTGTFSSGQKFSLAWLGGAMELTPVGTNGAAGTLAVIPDVTAGASCVSPATRFFVAGSFVLP